MTAKIIRLTLITSHILWIKHYEIIYGTVDGDTSVNALVELRSEVKDMLQDTDYYLFLSPTLLSKSPTSIEASELRDWLFEVYAIYKDKDAYEAINIRTRNINNFQQTTMNRESLDLRISVHKDHEERCVT